jgi:hypothetical protein
MSPEVITRRSVDPSANDTWTLGIPLYHIRVGELPRTSKDRETRVREIA